MRGFAWLRRSRRLGIGAVALTMVLVAAGVAVAARHSRRSRRSPPSTPTQITNLDVLRQQIRNYYGDPLGHRRSSPPTATTPRRRAASRRRASNTWPACHDGWWHPHGDQGDRPRRRRHLARDLELRDLQQLGVQPDDERRLRDRPEVPGRARAWSAMANKADSVGLRHLLPHRPRRPPRRPRRSATSPPTASASTPATRPRPRSTTARTASSPSRPSPTTRTYLQTACAGDPNGVVHDDPLQVGDPPAHRVARLRHRRQLRRPVQRPEGRLRRPHLQDAEPELLPALTPPPGVRRSAVRRVSAPDSERPGRRSAERRCHGPAVRGRPVAIPWPRRMREAAAGAIRVGPMHVPIERPGRSTGDRAPVPRASTA